MRRAAPSWESATRASSARGIGEDGQLHTLGLQPPKRRAHLGRGPEVDGGAVLGVALEQRSPVAGAPGVELGRRGRSILGQAFDVEHARRVGEPVAPERSRVAEHVELDCKPQRATRRQRATPIATPALSIRTSSGEPTRPATKCWCSSSDAAYATPTPSAGNSRAAPA